MLRANGQPFKEKAATPYLVIALPATPPSDSEKHFFALEVDTEPTLEQLQSWVGGYIEVAGRGKDSTGGWTLYVNEEGLLHRLPVNDIASRRVGLPIVGDAVLVAWSKKRGGRAPQ